ncbi:UNKNOWN [Stylonychia lemnae]|uniref:Uncharacterized protein n=1 Tax=Stylonychia lemnae TaxID=5949 RepID=A0A077ZSM4_STYLE|nr:UNKNOWN [Stylonychia lemnae]|eukprot:CDW71481.1 UNKNOWN [Stylonychia lemnae]
MLKITLILISAVTVFTIFLQQSQAYSLEHKFLQRQLDNDEKGSNASNSTGIVITTQNGDSTSDNSTENGTGNGNSSESYNNDTNGGNSSNNQSQSTNKPPKKLSKKEFYEKFLSDNNYTDFVEKKQKKRDQIKEEIRIKEEKEKNKTKNQNNNGNSNNSSNNGQNDKNETDNKDNKTEGNNNNQDDNDKKNKTNNSSNGDDNSNGNGKDKDKDKNETSNGNNGKSENDKENNGKNKRYLQDSSSDNQTSSSNNNTDSANSTNSTSNSNDTQQQQNETQQLIDELITFYTKLNSAHKDYYGVDLLRNTNLKDGNQIFTLFLSGGLSSIEEIQTTDDTMSSSSSSSSLYDTNRQLYFFLVVGVPLTSLFLIFLGAIIFFKFLMIRQIQKDGTTKWVIRKDGCKKKKNLFNDFERVNHSQNTQRSTNVQDVTLQDFNSVTSTQPINAFQKTLDMTMGTTANLNSSSQIQYHKQQPKLTFHQKGQSSHSDLKSEISSVEYKTGNTKQGDDIVLI